MLTPEELEESRITAMKVCEQSYLMYENSKREMVEVAAKKTDKNGAPLYTEQAIKKNLQLIETAQQDVIDQYIQMGGTLEDLQKLKSPKKKTVDRKHLQELMKKETARDELAKYIANLRANDVATKPVDVETQDEVEEKSTKVKEDVPYIQMEELQEKLNKVQKNKQQPVSSEITNQPEQLNAVMPSVDNTIGTSNKMYDFIKLPSKGQCYRHKKDKVKVGYLTAYDENMILSPSLYRDGKFIDYLLKAKVFENDIDPEDLTKGDRDAIVLWLRATGYGNEYPIIVTDDETGKDFETTVDLSTLNYKPFKLKGDENGYFDFVLPRTQDIIKFKFLTVRDLDILDRLKKEEDKKIEVATIRQLCGNLIDGIGDKTDLVSHAAKQKLKNAIETVKEELDKNYKEEEDFSFSHELTDRLLLQTVSINGITDRKYIENYIFSMNVQDAASYRKYIISNEPGVDFNIEVERPESLGGGSIKSFLRLDQFIFINV